MSSPIADTAEYFAQKSKDDDKYLQTPKPTHGGPRIFQNRELVSTPQQQEPLSPESPDSRRRPIPLSQSQTLSDFNPRQQWLNLLNKLPAIHVGQHDNGSSGDDSDQEQDSQSFDDEPTSFRNSTSFPMSRMNSANNTRKVKSYHRHPRQQQYIPHNIEDDHLPTTEEFSQETGEKDNHLDDFAHYQQNGSSSRNQEEPANYFVNPFKLMTHDSDEFLSPTPVGAVDASGNDGDGSGAGITTAHTDIPGETSMVEEDTNENHLKVQIERDPGKAKKQWGKTLDKVRLVANLHSLPQHSNQKTMQSSSSLIPYSLPLFDPVFIALSKDQHGHPWPPVLLPFLKIAITDSELSTQGINQWVFRIELQYGDIKWVIKRRIADFVSLHYTLKFKSRLSDSVPSPPPFPSQFESWLSSAKGTINMDDSPNGEEDLGGEKYQIALKRRKALTKYLRSLLVRAHMRANYDICEFFEISAVSIVEDMGWKGKEGFLENKINFVVPRLCHVIKPHLWNKQWVLLRDSYVAFLSDISSTKIMDVLLFDKSIVAQNKTPGLLGKYHNHITIENQFRRVEIKGNRREVEEWMKSIQCVLDESPWVKIHRFGSFAPVRHDAKLKWYVDAEDHFNAIGEAILSAKAEIYIADWWLSPELYLRRPPENNEEFRLDRLLQRKAEEGVKIYIVIYKEMAVALTINSSHTKLWLQDLHKNIIVVRSPDHRSIDNNVLFWSHHEKIVIVDNRLAFLGGLDLCWGRYDTQAHRLTDHPAEGHPYETFPGQDYSNPRVKDFNNVAQHDLTLINRNITPRMPWHDMTVGMVGPIARDAARHFIQRWNFLKSSKGMHRSSVPFLMPKGEYVPARDESSFRGSCRVQMLRSSAQWSSGVEREHSIYNAYMECITKSKHYIYIENQFFSNSTAEDKILKNKIAQAIVNRIKIARDKGEKWRAIILIPLIPAFEGDLASKDASAARNVMHFQYMTISRGGSSIIEKLREEGIEPSDYISWFSLRNWDKLVPSEKKTSPPELVILTSAAATGVSKPPTSYDSKTELNYANNDRVDSGQDQMSDLSQKSSLGTTAESASPQPATAIPADPLPLSTPCPSPKSIWDDDDREFYVSELVYIHDKILIVDDRIVLIGSANINDRSQLGNRDSEIAMLIEDTDMIDSYMDGKEYKAAKFAHSLRMQLFKEHLGLLDFKDWENLNVNTTTTSNNSSNSADNSNKDDKEIITALLDIQQPVDKEGVPISSTHPIKATKEEIKSFEKDTPDYVLNHKKRSELDSCLDHDHNHDNTKKTTGLDSKALDPLSPHFYNDIWNMTAETNTLVYRELFQCVPDDTVHTFEQHRKFLPDPTRIPHGHVADAELHGRIIRQKLSRVRGHLVQFPVNYLKDENMLGSFIRETVTPMTIFT